MYPLLQDIRFATRTLRRGWGVTLIAVASLAVGIAGNATVFGLISAVFLRPTSVVEPGRVALLQERRKDQSLNLGTLTTSLGTWADLQERSQTARAWAAYRPTVLGLRGSDRSDPVTAAEVTPGFFELVGAPLPRGRAFRADEGVPGAARVAIVRPEWWERERGAEGDPLGRTLVLNGEPYEVVGVLPTEFSFFFSTVDVWVPLTDDPRESPRDRRDVLALARLTPGATMEQLVSEVEALAARLETEQAATFRDWTIDVFNFRDDIPNTQTRIFYALLQGSVFFVLLIACVNITNLLLARGQERRPEIALRTVLGAGRGRIVRQLLTESALLASAGMLLGLLLGWYGIRLMAGRLAEVFPQGLTPRLDVPVLLFTLGISGLASLLFGLVPALQAFRHGQAEALKEGAGRTSVGRNRRLLTRSLVVAEIALSLVALGGGAMLVRSFLQLQNQDPGYDPTPILTAQLRIPQSKYPGDEQTGAFLDRVLERAEALGGVEAATLVNVLPQSFGAPTDTFRIQGASADPGSRARSAFSLEASPAYPATFGIELLQGRFFEASDRLGRAPVAVVNRSFAETWFPGENPVGRHLAFRGESREIVGVVDDVRQVLLQTSGQVTSEAVYVPVAQVPDGAVRVALRVRGDPERLGEPLRTALQGLDPDLTLSQVLTMEAVVDRAFTGVDIFNAILGGFGILAILLASVGTYGVLAYSVSQRRREIGIRMAVGAGTREVVRMVTGQGVAMAILGLGIGGLALLPLTRLLRSLMEGITTVSGGTSVAVAGVLFAVTLLASLLPARRASAVDPVTALREE